MHNLSQVFQAFHPDHVAQVLRDTLVDQEVRLFQVYLELKLKLYLVIHFDGITAS